MENPPPPSSLPPETAQKIDFFMRAFIGKREAIEAKKEDFEHLRKEKKEEKMNENERK